jgi:hypothetical protein
MTALLNNIQQCEKNVGQRNLLPMIKPLSADFSPHWQACHEALPNAGKKGFKKCDTLQISCNGSVKYGSRPEHGS